jgi:hypothetical protein
MAIDAKDEFLHGEDARRILDMEDHIGAMLASEGWKTLSTIGQEQANLRQTILMSWAPRPQGPSDDFLKGAIYGIRLLLDTPRAIMEQAQELHASRAEELNNAS